MGATGYDRFTTTSLGTGVTETELGTGLVTPSQARQIVSSIPWNGPTGAYTASQGSVAEMAFRSNSAPIAPKRTIAHGGNGGVGTFIDVLIPILNEFEFNSPLAAQSDIHCFGTQQTLNTVAFDGGANIRYDTSPPNRSEKFWMKPNDETSTGAAAARVVGGTIQITTGTRGGALTDLWGTIYAGGTETVSEGQFGSFEFVSSDYDDAMPLITPVQPVGFGLATSGMLQPVVQIWPCYKPMKNNTLITTGLFLDEAQTAAQLFIAGVGYVKT